MSQVYPATPYQPGTMGSLGKAAYMLICQHQFPNTYREDEKLMGADSDRCFQWDHDHARRCFTQHTGTGEGNLENWLRGATEKEIFAFLKDILKADSSRQWTGYRVMGTVNRSNGYPVWTLELFAKNPDGDTEVYTGSRAPNVREKKKHVSCY